MSHGELFLLLLLIFGCLSPMTNNDTWTSWSRVILLVAIIYNFVAWALSVTPPSLG